MKKILNKYIPLAIGTYFNTLALFSKTKAAEKAFTLFCTPRKGKVLPAQKSFLTDAKDDLMEISGNSIQTYRWKGDGPTLLLMHGWESNSFRWYRLIPKLQKEGYDIIAFDAPAHGYSSSPIFNVPLYADCAQKIIEKYRPQYVIGHSIGGMTILYTQHTYANGHIEKIVTLGAPSELSDFMRQYKKTLGLNTKTMKALEAYFIEIFNFKFADFSSPKFAETISAKGLLVHDELDAIAPIWSSEQVHAKWEDSVFIKTKGLGHSLHQDKVREKIIAFLKATAVADSNRRQVPV